jgi:hypothetical protein
MVVRIDTLQEGPVLVLRIAGSLAGTDVAVLGDLVARQGLPKRIDLSELEFADEPGVGALLGLEDRGVTLAGTDPYVELLLRARPGPEAGTEPDSSTRE